MRVEKSPVRASDRAGIFLLRQVAPLVLIAVSLACSASRSASSSSQLSSNQPVSQPATPVPSSSSLERTACTLTVSEAPAFGGLKVGMSVDELLALFPGSKGDAEVSAAVSKRGPFANGSLLIEPSKYKSPADFKDVSRVSISLLDSRVSGFTIHYNGPEWPHVDKFVEKFVEGKNLPTSDQWEPYAGMETQMKTLTCTGFSIQLFIGGEGGNQNYALFKDVEADKTLKERRKKAREQASPTPGQ